MSTTATAKSKSLSTSRPSSAVAAMSKEEYDAQEERDRRRQQVYMRQQEDYRRKQKERFRQERTISATALNAESTSRQDFLKTMVAVAAVPIFQLGAPEAASAAKYGAIGAGSPNKLDPTESIIDEDILKSGPVQDALKKVQGYSSMAKELSAALDKDPQADLGPVIRKQFDFVQLRSALNTLNTAFDEDTQRGTDRLIRLVMQDLTELETANRQKEGVVRSERRLGIMKGKLDKLGTSFDDFLAFAK